MEKSGERPLAGAAIAAIALLLAFLVVGALAATNPPIETPAQPVYTRHPLDKLDRDLTIGERGASKRMGEEVNVIIRLHTSEEPRGKGFTASLYSFEHAKSEVLDELSSGDMAALSEQQVKDLPAIGAIALTVPTRKLNQLAYLDAVEHISEDRPVYALLGESVPFVGAPEVWGRNDTAGNNLTGQGITIAIIDTGIDYTHADLGGCTQAQYLAGNCKVLPGWDYVNGDNESLDDNGHGTHVAGIAAANGTLKGTAPDATLVAYKVLDSSGKGYTSDVLLAIQNATAAGYDIISLSLGADGSADDDLSLAADNAVNAGVVVVASAGNSGSSLKTIRSPGNSRNAITVGNTDKADGIRSTSSRGPASGSNEIKPDLMAPGVDINSTSMGGGYELMNGTSMSAPHVSGAAALLLQKNPTWTPTMVKGALVGYTKDVGLRAVDQGAGRLMVNHSIDAQVIGGSVSLSLGTISSSSTNTTYVFNITNLLNASVNVTLSSAVVTNTNASSSLNQSLVNISALGSADIELLVNWSAGNEGYVDGRISADNLTIPFMLEVAGYRTIVVEDVGGDEVYDVLIRDINNDGSNELIMSYDDGSTGRVRYAKYNSSVNNWTLHTIAVIDDVSVVNAGDVDNDTLNEVVSGDWDGMFRVYEYNATDSSWIETYNFTTDAQAIEEIEIADIDNDSITEVLLTSYNNSDNGKIWQFKIINGTWNYTVLHKAVYVDRLVAMKVGDVDNDGLPEIVWENFSATLEHVQVSNYINGMWNHSLIDTLQGTTSNIIKGIAIGDVDEDGENEIVVSGGNNSRSWVRVYNYLGNLSWSGSYIFNGTGGMAFVSDVGDANNDGVIDIVFGLENGLGVRLLERQSDNVTWVSSVMAQNLPGGRQVRRVDIGDATNNGIYEIASGYGFGANSASYIFSLIEDPRISAPTQTLSNLSPYDSQFLTSRVQDSDGLDTVVLYWRNGTVAWNEVNMTLLDTQNYTGSTASQPWNTTIEYFIRATDFQSASNQTPIFNYTVLVNRLGNETDVFTSLSNLTVWIANATLNVTYLSAEEVELRWNSSPLVVFTHPFEADILDLRNVTINASQDNETGWTHVKNLTLPAGVNKTLYVSHWNSSADAVCVLDADVESIVNVSAGCTGTSETLVPCINSSISGYICENISGRWKLSGANYTAVKEMVNPAPTLSGFGPSGTVATSSTTFTVTTNEAATCKYSTTSQAYSAMPSTFTTTGSTSHSESITGLSNGAYTYYVRCQDNGNKESSEGTITFTVSITTTPSGGGGGGGAPAIDPDVKETTFSSLTPDKEHRMFVDRATIAATKVGFVNTVQATNVKLRVSVVNISTLADPLDLAYDYFNVTLEGLYAHELSEAWLEFRLKTSWIADNGATKDDVRLKRYRTRWENLGTTWMKDSGDYSYFNATSPGFSIFAIALVTAEEPEPVEPVINQTIEPEINKSVEPEVNQSVEPPIVPPEPRKPRALLYLTILLLIALVAGGIVYLRKRKPKKPAESPIEKLTAYVNECRDKGFSNESIKKRLRDSGYNSGQIHVAMKQE